MIDDSTRILYSEVILDKKAKTVVLFLRRAHQWFKDHWVLIKAILCDNGKEFTTHREQGKAKHIFTVTCNELSIKQKFTRVRKPQTNWKIERFWRTSNNERFSVVEFKDWNEVVSSLKTYMNYYNYHRKHWALWWSPPMKRLQEQLSKPQ